MDDVSGWFNKLQKHVTDWPESPLKKASTECLSNRWQKNFAGDLSDCLAHLHGNSDKGWERILQFVAYHWGDDVSDRVKTQVQRFF